MKSISFHFPDLATEQQRIQARQELMQQLGRALPVELSHTPFDVDSVGSKNCENLIGSVAIPVGVAGPVSVAAEGFSDKEDLLIPLATSEGALVASVNRGCKAINAAGGASITVQKIGMSRAPVFRCQNGRQAHAFAQWLLQQTDLIKEYAEATSSHLTFTSVQPFVRGRYVYARFVFDTDQAMGMNMVTIGLQHALPPLLAQYHQPVELVSISSNVCTDKKDSVINRIFGRGYWVQAEVVVPDAVITSLLKVDPEVLVEAHVIKNLMGSNVAGSLSQNMQAANMVAAVFLATGQDMAHVVEGSQGSTVIERTAEGIWASVTLPNINVGVVGGGTTLPAQTQARHLIRDQGSVSAEQLAGVVGVAVLAGELSGLAALATHTLAQAHQRLGRGK